MTFDEYKVLLSENVRNSVVKIEWLNEDGLVVDEISDDIIDGDINIELKNGVRRDCTISFKNNNGLYTPTSDGYIYLNKKFKLYTGLKDGTDSYYNLQGVFNLGNPKIEVGIADNVCKIEAFDNFSLLNGTIEGELPNEYIIPVDTALTTAIKAILSETSIETDPIIYPNSEILPYTIIKEAGGTYADLLKELADVFSWVVYFDVTGRLRFEPPVDEQNTSAIETFDDSEVTFLGFMHEYQYYDVKNNIIVYGDNINGDLATGQAQDTGLFSHTSVDRIGLRTKVIFDTIIYSDELAQDRAEYELKKAVQIYESAELKVTPKDYLKEGDIVYIDNELGGFDRAKCLIKKINLPISYDKEQSLTIWRIREI